MRAHQCPRCDLRFLGDAELKWHLIDDHGVEPAFVETRFVGPPPGIHERRIPPDPTHRSILDGPTP